MVNYLIRINDYMQLVNIAVAVLTNIGAVYLAVVMLHWCYRLRYSRTDLRPLIFGIFTAKAALWLWTFLNIINIIVFDESQPNITLPARVLFLVAVVIQVYVTLKVQATPDVKIEKELDRDCRLVLIVEDNEALGRVYRRCLQSVGIDAEFATTGKDALVIINQEKPRMMIVDLALPDMDGVELVALARVAGYIGPIVAISGAADLMDDEKLRPAGFSQVIAKPLRSQELISMVYRWT